ncbi:AmmeMemoRadiSam system protein B [Oceanispirochaeta crateris]|uniref:AmmeMemoRadiSam system protein B n=1 Tax=Oceanispirochaeta crateris TaxID=2518645 RepID=A0A5C1QJU1_9SPIO|nr:AmmeMemoRadiSam system protein B [Oceanispirochaeta crateris]QEN08385.1 AmmeMemoRadiSam system protein B [Oceanispirochaeta crateris]
MDILKKDIRKPIVSGLFYPDNPEELKAKIEALMNGCPRGDAAVILCPHGTWDKTGESLGAAFAAASEFKPDRVLLLGPVHREKDRRVLYLSSKKYFETALGFVNVDSSAALSLTEKSDLFVFDDSPHMEEHALELQIPFIQTLFPQVEIIPLLLGGLKRSDLKKAAGTLKQRLFTPDKKILVVLSANLSRYGLASQTEAEAQRLLDNLEMPLKRSLKELETEGLISSCGTALLTLLSDLGILQDKTLHILKRDKTELLDRGELKAVYYAGISWS